ncbi:MAG: SPOR domain-containing protein [Candidatus Manganitrophus sp.]|nr:MAG: SPOR domain-containing protein [Candidatus Manganitrophus sp.]
MQSRSLSPRRPPSKERAVVPDPGQSDSQRRLDLLRYLEGQRKEKRRAADEKRDQAGSPKNKAAAGKKSDPKKVSVPPPTSGPSGAYTIQVASFADQKGAETLSQKLKKKGYEAYVAAGEVPEKGTRYRVRIGHYPSRAEAQKAAEGIQEAEKLSFLITTDSGK